MSFTKSREFSLYRFYVFTNSFYKVRQNTDGACLNNDYTNVIRPIKMESKLA